MLLKLNNQIINDFFMFIMKGRVNTANTLANIVAIHNSQKKKLTSVLKLQVPLVTSDKN